MSDEKKPHSDADAPDTLVLTQKMRKDQDAFEKLVLRMREKVEQDRKRPSN